MLRRIGSRVLRQFGLQRIPQDPLAPRHRITKELIASILPAAPVIVEAGAHNGDDTVDAVRAMPRCTIHAFEPVPALFEKLTLRTASLPNVHRYNRALSDVTGTATMYISSGGTDASSSLLKPKDHLDLSPHVRFESQIEVRTVTLDDWAAENRVAHVDFIWLDLQGAELAALCGAIRLLESARAICAEVNLIETYEGNPLYHEIRAWLRGRGFEAKMVDLLYPDGGNVLFVRRPDAAMSPAKPALASQE